VRDAGPRVGARSPPLRFPADDSARAVATPTRYFTNRCAHACARQLQHRNTIAAG